MENHSHIQVICPSCGTGLELPSEGVNCKVECPKCEHQFVATVAEPITAPKKKFVKSAREKRVPKKKKKSILPYILLIFLGAGAYFAKSFYEKYQGDLASRAQEKAERVEKRKERERLAAEKSLEQQRLNAERLADEKRQEAERQKAEREQEELDEIQRLKEEQLLEEQRLAALEAEKKATEEEEAAKKKEKKKKKKKKESVIVTKSGEKVIKYKPKMGDKTHNRHMEDEDAKAIQDKLQVVSGSGEDLDKAVMGMRYHNQCLISPLGQLGGFGVAIQRDKGLYLYRLAKKGLLEKAGLKQWDRIISVNKRSLGSLDQDIKAGEGPIVLFGHELNRIEGEGGALLLTVKREGEKIKTYHVPLQKRYSFPKKDISESAKAQSLINLTLKILSNSKLPDDSWPSGYGTRYTNFQVPLAFLSAGDKQYNRMLKRAIYRTMELDQYNWTWGPAMKTILLAEYFWATGDMKVYKELQEMGDLLTTYINPTGGTAQKFREGTYWGVNFGPTSSLVCLALSMCERCGVAIDQEKRDQNLDNYTRNKKGYIAGYNGYLGGSLNYLGERGFTTAVVGLALSIEGSNKKVAKNISKNLTTNFKEINYIHGTPSQGMLFGSLALARMNPKAYQQFIDYYRWYLTVAHLPDNNIFYITPRHSRMAIPGGGGWGGDAVLGRSNLAPLQVSLMLSAGRKNLLLAGNDTPGRISGKKNILKTVLSYQKKRYEKILSTAKKALSSGQVRKAYDRLAYIKKHYAEAKFVKMNKVDALIKTIKKKSDWADMAKTLKEEEAADYYDWARQLRTTTKIKYLKKFIQLYGSSPLVEDAKKAIKDTALEVSADTH